MELGYFFIFLHNQRYELIAIHVVVVVVVVVVFVVVVFVMGSKFIFLFSCNKVNVGGSVHWSIRHVGPSFLWSVHP